MEALIKKELFREAGDRWLIANKNRQHAEQRIYSALLAIKTHKNHLVIIQNAINACEVDIKHLQRSIAQNEITMQQAQADMLTNIGGVLWEA